MGITTALVAQLGKLGITANRAELGKAQYNCGLTCLLTAIWFLSLEDH